jgi:hypothetical protein
VHLWICETARLRADAPIEDCVGIAALFTRARENARATVCGGGACGWRGLGVLVASVSTTVLALSEPEQTSDRHSTRRLVRRHASYSMFSAPTRSRDTKPAAATPIRAARTRQGEADGASIVSSWPLAQPSPAQSVPVPVPVPTSAVEEENGPFSGASVAVRHTHTHTHTHASPSRPRLDVLSLRLVAISRSVSLRLSLRPSFSRPLSELGCCCVCG